MPLTYEQQAARFRRMGAEFERNALRLSEQAQAEKQEFPKFSRQLQASASAEMRRAVKAYDSAARAAKRADILAGQVKSPYQFGESGRILVRA